MSDSVLVVIPTFNERKNIEAVLEGVFSHLPKAHILVVDDNSSDGTGEYVAETCRKEERLHLLSRPRKEGLGPAYIAGLKWGLEKAYAFLLQMDCDLSHDPEHVSRIVEKLRDYDLVVGSRYIEGGGIGGWPWNRLLLSRVGNLYARSVLGVSVRDMTGGFNGWRREALEKIQVGHVTSQGYAFMIEVKYRAFLSGCRVVEVPIFFQDRRYGTSKMSSNIIFEAILRVAQLRWRRDSLK